MNQISFPKNFVWGTASASYQIEGAISQDGKGPSIWDEFSHRKGAIKNGDTGDIACDHYNKMQEDVNLMHKLGYPAYRFSVSWPRVYPSGKSILNERGLSFYDRLVDSLLKKKIEPYITLYHWDLPLSLEKEGGWLNRDTAEYFGEYTETVVRRLGDRVKNWITLNEPWIVLVCGYLLKVFPPGLFKPFSAMKVAHNLLLAHGVSAARIKSLYPKSNVGITNALMPVYSYRLDKESSSVKRADAILNQLWLDPIFKGKYPDEISKEVERQNKENLREGDLKIISTPIDFLGINNYSRMVVKPVWFPFYNFRPVNVKYKGAKFTSMDWEIFPEGLYVLLKRIREEYANPPVFITENGVAFYEKLESGELQDPNRIHFLQEYLFSVHRAIMEGCDVRGYFVWTFMDNFEWASGYEKTFGLVHVDRNTLKRTPKASAHWYSHLIKKNGFQFQRDLSY
jgi:beta-glucosidase